MAGASGAQVGLASDRELAARALAAVINYDGAQDPDTLSFIISVSPETPFVPGSSMWALLESAVVLLLFIAFRVAMISTLNSIVLILINIVDNTWSVDINSVCIRCSGI